MQPIRSQRRTSRPPLALAAVCLAMVAWAGCGGDDDEIGAVAPAATVSTTVTRPATGTPTTPVGSATAGRTIFETRCQLCHKLSDAEVGAGPRLVGAGLTESAIKEQVLNPRDSMPPNLASGQDLDDVTAFILQLR